MIQNEASLMIVTYDRKNFIVQATDWNSEFFLRSYAQNYSRGTLTDKS